MKVWWIDVTRLYRDIWEWKRKIRNVKGLRWETGKGCSQKKKKGKLLGKFVVGMRLNWTRFGNGESLFGIGRSSLLFERWEKETHDNGNIKSFFLLFLQIDFRYENGRITHSLPYCLILLSCLRLYNIKVKEE